MVDGPGIERGRGALRIQGQGGLPATLLGQFLGAIDHAYNGVIVFDELMAGSGARLRRRWRDMPPWDWPAFPLVSEVPGLWDVSNPDWVSSLVLPSDRLVVARVRLASPGIWEFLGQLNPLEVLRQYLEDRHRRRQDREYREQAEARRLNLENDLLETRVIRERVALARDVGVPDELLAPLVNQLLVGPLDVLGTHEDRGVIDASDAQVARRLPPESE
jgi:hypothetical protein